MIGVFGESVIDLITQPNGDCRPYIGGSPYNVAMALGLQQAPVKYLTPLSEDGFGELLLNGLRAADVEFDPSYRSAKPSALAVVKLDEAGKPQYSLYREGIADRDYSVEQVMQQIPTGMSLLHTGSLALIPAELDKIRRLFEALKLRGCLISLDINVRPDVVGELDEYSAGLRSLFSYCDILKASDEDLHYLGFDQNDPELPEQLLTLSNASLVAITYGAQGALIANTAKQVKQPALRVEEIGDTVGAGDCFQAGMLAALQRLHCLDKTKLASLTPELLDQILGFATASAAFNVQYSGCHPPTLEQVAQQMAVLKHRVDRT